MIDRITVEDNSALVQFLSSEHRPPINPGTDFYVEYAEESKAGQTDTLASILNCRSEVPFGPELGLEKPGLFAQK